jgi:hypothetical protein
LRLLSGAGRGSAALSPARRWDHPGVGGEAGGLGLCGQDAASERLASLLVCDGVPKKVAQATAHRVALRLPTRRNMSERYLGEQVERRLELGLRTLVHGAIVGELSFLETYCGVGRGSRSLRPVSSGTVDGEHDRRWLAKPTDGRRFGGATGVTELTNEALTLDDELVG